MKTWQAMLVHLGLGALQAVAGAGTSSSSGLPTVLSNPAIQFGAQAGLMALQGWVASKNSKSDPNGNKLVQQATGSGFVTSTK